MAQEQYYGAADAKPARVGLYFANARGKKRDKRELARVLAEFVTANVHQANPVANFVGLELPEGLGSMSIASESGKWWCGESGVVTVSDIREALASSISKKNQRLSAYHKSLGPGAQVWLLLYSTIEASRSMPIPCSIEEWRFHFGFDRVFWFACLENEFVEIHRVESTEQVLREVHEGRNPGSASSSQRAPASASHRSSPIVTIGISGSVDAGDKGLV
jgi:hypothetical protein